MRYTRLIAVGIAFLHVSVTGAHAQNRVQNPVPAEFPPSSYTGTQYVDSRGCIFVRAGIDGNVTWVPRVTRDRRQVCGATPSLAGVPTARVVPTAPGVEQIVPADAVPPSAAPQRVISQPPQRAPASRPVMAASTVAVPLVAGRTETRILPSHLVDSRTAQRLVIVPDGFEPVWTDGRLNPRRGEQSVEGYKQSQKSLTLQVPRRAVRGDSRIKEPRIVSNDAVRTSRVEFFFVATGEFR